MKILVIADPMLPVPPPKYGGTERVVDLMCRGLVGRGHQIRLLGATGSRNYGAGVATHRAPSPAYVSRASRKIWFQFLSLWAARDVDVVINYGRLDYLEALYRLPKPILHWFQNPLTGREIPFLLSRRRHADTFISVSSAQIAGEAERGRFQVVHNAMEVETVPFSSAPATPPYVLFLGRLTHNKGVHLAIAAARKAGVRLIIGGKVPADDEGAKYFETEVKPHLGRDCEWVGEYDDATRIALLAGATALLFPIQWAEPFGLVMIESLAAGVPVIATRVASTPEVITPGQNGFLCDSVEEMAMAIARAGQISRYDCRVSAERRFGAPAFLDRVEKLIAQATAA
jgi:glycosyltransferase involved in cell wall biosynthesis